MGDVHALTLRNDRTELARMVAWTDAAIARLCVSGQTAHAVHLCLEEAVANILSYAFDPGSEHDIRISLWRDGDMLHADVVDDGRPFDPLGHVPSDAPKDLGSAQVGGLGIKLIRHFASAVAYQRCGKTNRLRLSFAMQ